MEFEPKRQTLTPFAVLRDDPVYKKLYGNSIYRAANSNLGKSVKYDKNFDHWLAGDLYQTEINYSSIEKMESEELCERMIYNQKYSTKKPTFGWISTFPKDDIRHFSRKTAYYNKEGTAESHYLRYFKRKKIVNLISESSNKNYKGDLGYKISYEYVSRGTRLVPKTQRNIEIRLTENEPPKQRDRFADKFPIKPTEVDCHEQVTPENIVKNVNATITQKKRRKHKKYKKNRKKKGEEELKKDASESEIVDEVAEIQTEVVCEPTTVDSDTLEADKADEEDELSVEVTHDGEKVDENTALFEIDFSKLMEQEKESESEEYRNGIDSIIVSEKGKNSKGHKKNRVMYEDGIGNESVIDDLTTISAASSVELVTTPEKNDKATVTYVSEDKMFLITGTLGGFVHIWSFLQPYPSSEEKRLIRSYFNETERRMSIKGDQEDEGMSEYHMMINDTPLRKLETLGWSNINGKPDVSFKAHESSIISLQITPKMFSRGKIDYILVTTSLDRTLKVWKLSNLDKRQNRLKSIINECEYSNGGTSKDKGARIELIGWLEDLEDIFVNASFIPNTGDKIIVTRYMGWLEKFRLDLLDSTTNKTSESNMTSIARVNTDQSRMVGSISTSCNYYAVGGLSGNVSVYDVETLQLLDSCECKNAEGPNSMGKDVTGIDWNKKDDFMLVTTLDSRIRLLSFKTKHSTSFYPEEYGSRTKYGVDNVSARDKRLSYVEKFKGHTNRKNYYKAKFFGTSEEIVMCPSESGHIYVWKIESPLYNNNQVKGKDAEEKLKLDNGVVKNDDCYGFKIGEKGLLASLDIYNVNEWDKLLKVILSSRRNEVEEGERKRCLICRNKPKNENPCPNNDLLMVSSQNGSEIKYSVIDVRYF